MKTPIVTIVGRPNVGKSTFFNKVAGKRIAIESDIPGTTRDRIFYKMEHEDIDYYLVDTGGLTFGKSETTIESDVKAQAQVAIREADVIVFMVNSREPLVSEDFKIAELLRKGAGEKPVFLVVSKVDKPLEEAELAPLYSLGMGQPHGISALHGNGVDHILEEIVKTLKNRHFILKNDERYKKEDEGELKVALVGRPNVGKSSLINALLSENKLIVSDIPGTTRDSVDTIVKCHGKAYNFIDTAGLRRPGRIEAGIEKISSLKTFISIENCDVALLTIDSSIKLSHQDQQIAAHILKAGKGILILVNKWDLKTDNIDEDDDESRREKYSRRLRNKFVFLSWAPVLFTSAVNKKNLTKIFEIIEEIQKEREKRIGTGELNGFLKKLSFPPSGGRSKPKIYYMTQVETKPPHFIAFINRKSNFHFSTDRFLENRMREAFKFYGTPIRIDYREKEKQKDRE